MKKITCKLLLVSLCLLSCEGINDIYKKVSTALYSITYNPNGNTGGTIPVQRQFYPKGEYVNVRGNSGGLVKTGFIFNGWNTTPEGTGATFSEGEKILIENYDINLYAKWITETTQTYRVRYDANGATGGYVPENTTSYIQGQNCTVSDNYGNLNRPGYFFIGWNTKSDGSGGTYLPGSIITIGTSDIVLYAKWEIYKTAVITPGAGSWLASEPGKINSELTVYFGTSMNTSTLVLSGTMAANSSYSWSTTSFENDTLIITPLYSRLSDYGSDISIQCYSINNENYYAYSNYSLARSVYYVKPNAAGALSGTRSDPMANIQSAVNNAAASGTPAVVLVSEGTFTTSSTMVTMAESVSLYGGYSASNWDLRDWTNYPTVLQDTRTSIASPSYPYDPIRIIEITDGITAATILDGFSFIVAPFNSGPSSPSAAAIFIRNASPVIRNNSITSTALSVGSTSGTIGICHVNGGNAEIYSNSIALGSRTGSANNCSNYGIYYYNGAYMNIHDNSINAGTCAGTNGYTYGIYINQNCGGSIHSNYYINGGSASATSYGIFFNNSSMYIGNNSLITASSTSQAWGIYISQSSPTIEKNYIQNFSSPEVRGIQVASQSRPVISSNYIDTGGNSTATGIYVNNEDTGNTAYTDIYNNIINAGQCSTKTTGIEIASENTRVRILNNTINGGGNSNSATGINIVRTAAPSGTTVIDIANNHIFTDNTSASSFGIRESTSANAYPNIVYNNNIFHCNVLYFNFIDGVADNPITTTPILNAFTPDGSIPAQNNISEDIYPYLDTANGYYYAGDTGLFSFDTWGIDYSGIFTYDRNGVMRTIPWTVGAYEHN